MSQPAKLSDPSGRGKVAGYDVTFPTTQHRYTQAEIDAVVKAMAPGPDGETPGQTQGKYLEQF